MVLVLCCLATALFAQSASPTDANAESTPGRTPALEDLFSDLSVVDAAFSQSGRYLAMIARRPEEDPLLVYDPTNGGKKCIQRAALNQAGPGLSPRMGTVNWKSDDRILCRLYVRPIEGSRGPERRASRHC